MAHPLESINIDADHDNTDNIASSHSHDEHPKQEVLNMKVQHLGKVLKLTMAANSTVKQLKTQLEELTKIQIENQKLISGGKQLSDDEKQLTECGLKSGSIMRLVGTTPNDIEQAQHASANTPNIVAANAKKDAPIKLCEREEHKKIIGKGPPEFAWPGILNDNEPLPSEPLRGMCDKQGSELRLSFKLENDQIWIANKERTRKVPMNTIHDIVSEPITGFEHYHILAIQLGPTEQSRVWFYWVPAQYVRSIKNALR